MPRFRVHIRNDNARTGSLRAGGGDFTGIWHGEHAGGGAFTAAPQQLLGAFSTPADGSEWVSPWLNAQIGGGTDWLLSFAYTSSATLGPHYNAGGAYRDDASAAHGGTVAPALVKENLVPFDIWLEAETPASTPVIAGFGDSLTCGIGANLTVHDSWVSQYARMHSALPVHYAIGGTTMDRWFNVNGYYWDRWQGLSRPDAVIWAMGSNDVFTGTSLADIQARHATIAPILAEKVTPHIYAATIMPRTSQTGATEDVRRAYNAWLTTLPGGAKDLFDFAASISLDDETIIPEYNSDGTHLTTSGYAENAEAINRAITAPAPAPASLTARVDKLEARSGLRDITTLFGLASGQALLEVRDGTVWLDFVNAAPTGSGNVEMTATGLEAVATEAPVTSRNLLILEGAGTLRRLQINMYGRALVYAHGGGVLNGTVSWPMTRPAPAIWPGDPA